MNPSYCRIYILQVLYETLLCSIWTTTKFKDFHQRLKGTCGVPRHLCISAIIDYDRKVDLFSSLSLFEKRLNEEHKVVQNDVFLCYIIVSLRELRRLSALDNKLEELPAELGHLTKLSEISLTSNKLSRLPQQLCQCKDVTELHVARNQLTSLPGVGVGRWTSVSHPNTVSRFLCRFLSLWFFSDCQQYRIEILFMSPGVLAPWRNYSLLMWLGTGFPCSLLRYNVLIWGRRVVEKHL